MARVAVAALDPDGAPAETLSGVHRVLEACHVEANPIEPYRSAADAVAFLRSPPASEPRRCWTAASGSGVVGFAMLGLPARSAVASAQVLVVPEARRQGSGQSLLAAAAGAARAAGRARLVGVHATPAGDAFAVAVGATPVQRDVRSLLRLDGPSAEVPAVDGYRLVSWNGSAPADLVTSFARARNAIDDAPHPEGLEVPWDARRVRDLEQAVARRGRQIRVTVALDAAGGVVAFTELRVSAAPGSVASTEDTAVLPAHRGLGLGRCVKAESLRRLRAERPDVVVVGTTNAETNAAILAVNRSLGFLPVVVSTTCVLRLEP